MTQPKIVDLFLEDEGHRLVVSALVERLFSEAQIPITQTYRNATGGRPKVFSSLAGVTAAMRAGDLSIPDVLVVAVDGNCQKFGPTKKKIDETIASSIPSIIVRAIPDPHVERWLLLDSNAFRQALGIGCNAPDNRCERDRYKYLLASAVSSSGVTPLFSGLEHAREIVRHMDIERVAAADSSFGNFVGDAKSAIAQLAAR